MEYILCARCYAKNLMSRQLFAASLSFGTYHLPSDLFFFPPFPSFLFQSLLSHILFKHNCLKVPNSGALDHICIFLALILSHDLWHKKDSQNLRI